MNTVAEGIETLSQAVLMQQLKCGRGRGFLWAKPLEPAALAQWLCQRAEPVPAAA